MTIRIYCGHGSNKIGAGLLMRKFEDHLGTPVARIDEHEIRTGQQWRKDTTALVFSGMSVGGFKAALGNEAQDMIRQHVFEGAFDFIGICAGAAFGSDKIKYRMKDHTAPAGITKIQNTGLAFFNGLATGPARSVTSVPYTGWTDNLHLVTLRDTKSGQSYNAFHWGGPALIPTAPIHPHQGRIFATLEGDGTPLGLSLKHGQGKATLISYHPEIDRENLWEWAVPYIIEQDERIRLHSIAQNFSSDAFPRFLVDAGLIKPSTQDLTQEKRPALVIASP